MNLELRKENSKMAKFLENILNNARLKGITSQKSQESIDWFRKNVRKTAVSSSRIVREEQEHLVNSWTNVGFGQLYFVHYDPKHKKTLPVYDTFPLIIPIHRYKDGFLGMNLHYLPPILRAKLLDELYSTESRTDISARKKFNITYSKLISFSNHALVKPTIKRYLGNHFRSRFVKLPYEQWTAAVFLPVENFEKQSKAQVWNNSRKIIG
jgi:hypothetical protein